MKRLSGDQNGKEAASGPCSTCGVNESSARTQRRGGFPEYDATKVTMRPSGETAICGVEPAVSVDVNTVFSGKEMGKRTALSGVDPCGKYRRATSRVANNAVESATVASQL